MLLLKSRYIKAISAIAILTSLAGCGYQPLYSKAQTARTVSVQQEISNVWIDEIEDREGQLLHNELLTLFNTKGRPTRPSYRLKVTYDEGFSGLGVGKDEFATRANLTATADFRLTGSSNFSGKSQSVVSYNNLLSPTGTEFAKRDAQKRAIKILAQDIHRRIAVHLLTSKNKPKPE